MSAKPYEEYYKDLYQLQDGVFSIMENQDFYLTGGTHKNLPFVHVWADSLDPAGES